MVQPVLGSDEWYAVRERQMRAMVEYPMDDDNAFGWDSAGELWFGEEEY